MSKSKWFLLLSPFLLLVLTVPVLFLLYAASGALFGLAILMALAAIQYPIFVLLRRHLPNPAEDPDDSKVHRP
jgi:hypothetical protein